MNKMIIEGNRELSGTIKVSGAKNSVVALIPAAILSNESTIYNVPNISDTKSLIDILEYLGVETKYEHETLYINNSNIQNKEIPESLAKKLRASYYFMGALISRFKYASLYFPGGCKIGTRPIDQHIKGFEKMGVKITVDGDKYTLDATNIHSAKIYLDVASVGATINLMIAATTTKGTTIISNAAKEPEIVNIASFLNSMGARIIGAGSSVIKIEGVKELKNGVIETIPDRIEAGTYIIAGALIGKNLTIDGIIKEHLDALLSKLKDMDIEYVIDNNKITISRPKEYKPINVKTLVFPGFPTDLGQPIQVLLTQANGKSVFEETIYENRIGHIKYLEKMGANIKLNNRTAYYVGPTPLIGTDVVATDLRAGASLVLAGLIASGTTTISEINHILRGYEDIVNKLNNVGAKISLSE